MARRFSRAWLEISRRALEHNVDVLQSHARDAKMCYVIKADAYGHGASTVYNILKESEKHRRAGGEGSMMCAVATMDEASAARREGINGTLLVMGALHPLEAEHARELGVIPTICSRTCEGAAMHQPGDAASGRGVFQGGPPAGRPREAGHGHEPIGRPGSPW